MAERERFELSELLPTRQAARGPRCFNTASALRAYADERSKSSNVRCTHETLKPGRIAGFSVSMAERERFELSERSSRSSAFEAGAFNHSTTSPRRATGLITAPPVRCLLTARCHAFAGRNAAVARRLSARRTPASTSMRWLVPRERKTSNAPPSAPPLGSLAP